METCHYSRLFLTFVTESRANNARIHLEARCQLLPDGTEKPVVFVLGAPCKAEGTCAPQDLLLDPNYDFCPVFSDIEYALNRTCVTAEPNEGEKPCGAADHQGLWALTGVGIIIGGIHSKLVAVGSPRGKRVPAVGGRRYLIHRITFW